jgi:beta-lactam-binding protein with PASTA domain
MVCLGLLALGVFLLGAVSGWLVNDQYEKSHSVAQSESESTASTSPVASMPDVRGLAENRAGTVLSDAGLGSVSVDRVEQPFTGRAGVVIDQRPAPGASNPQAVQLSVSVPAVMPDVLGTRFSGVRDQLVQLGAAVSVRYRCDRQPDGVVL